MIGAFCVVPLGTLVVDALAEAKLELKDAYLSMGIDKGRFSKALQGQPGYSLDLHKMRHLPQAFWWAFWPAFFAALARDWMEREQEDARMRAVIAAADAARLQARPLKVERERPQQQEVA